MVSTATASTQEVRQGDLVLRIRGTSRHGQIVRLQSEKCTLGSGPSCTLRLRARGVGPLHCLIVRGPSATVVRRWHPDTRLNGHAFNEALLSPGDRLSVGPLEFEVLEALLASESSDARSTAPSEPEAATVDEPDSRRQLDALEALEAELDARQQALEEERRQHASDQSKTEEELRAKREEFKALAAELKTQRESLEEERRRQESQQSKAEAELRAQREELQAQAAELEAQRKSLEDERREHESDRPKVEAELHAQREELKALAAELEGRQRAIEEQHRRWEAERADVETRLQSQQAELETLQQSLEADRQQREAECDEREKELAGRGEELDAQQAELEAARRALEEERRHWEIERDEAAAVQREPQDERADEAQPSRPAIHEAPLSSLEILRRMGNMPVFPDDENEPRESETPAAKGRAGAGLPNRDNPSHAASEGDEESIDDYMARLLQRVRGVVDDGGVAEPPRRAPQPDTPVAPERGTTPSDSDTEASGSRTLFGKRREPVEMSPRAEAPEKHIDMTAMREVANFSAQNALDWHSRRVQGRVVATKAIVMLLGALASAILLYLWHSVPSPLTFSAAMVSLVVVVLWGGQYFVLIARRFGRRRRVVEQPPQDDASSEAQPLEVEILLAIPPAHEPAETEGSEATEASVEPAAESKET